MQEYELPNGVILEFDDGVTQEQADQYARQFMQSPEYQDAALGYLQQQGQNAAESLSQQQDNYTFVDALKDVPGNFIPSMTYAVGDVVNAAMHPVDTGTAIAKTAAGYGQKLGLPGNEYVPYADAMNQYFADRYGGWNNFKTTLGQDPFGVVSDASAALTGGAGVAKGISSGLGRVGAKAASEAVGKAGNAIMRGAKAFDPITIPGLAVESALGKLSPAAERWYQSALKLNSGFSNNSKARFSPEEVQRIIRAGLDTRTPITESGYLRTEQRIRDLSAPVNNAIDAADAAGLRLDPEQMARDALWSEAREEIRRGNDPLRDLTAFDNSVTNYLDAHINENTHRAAQEGKKATYQQFQKRYQNNAAPTASGSTDAAIELARQQRMGLENSIDSAISNGIIPDYFNGKTLREVNEDIGSNMALRDAMERSLLNSGKRDMADFLVGAAMATAAGPLAGGAAAFGKQTLKSPGLKSNIGIKLDQAGKLADNYILPTLDRVEPWRRGILSYLYSSGRADDVNGL